MSELRAHTNIIPGKTRWRGVANKKYLQDMGDSHQKVFHHRFLQRLKYQENNKKISKLETCPLEKYNCYN